LQRLLLSEWQPNVAVAPIRMVAPMQRLLLFER
jgi:hypothetical protein